MINPSDIKFNLQCEFHMLRHFEIIDDITASALINSGYNNTEIRKELVLPGSKFFKSFASNISTLLNIVLSHPYEIITGVNDNLILKSTIPKSEFPDGIGTHTIISKSEIHPELQQQFFLEKNRNYQLSHLIVDKLPVTNICTLILKPLNEGYLFITAFAGEPAMPVPDEKMSKEIFEKCVDFWSAHVFLKNAI